jgi:hypothetical protein
MVAETAAEIVVKGDRARIPYSLNPIIQETRVLDNEYDTALIEALADLDASIDDDGVIDRTEYDAARVKLIDAYLRGVERAHITELLDVSGPDAANRAVERSQKRRNLRQGKR